jgi:D-sedoheptulose 7-phosphate isomerase
MFSKRFSDLHSAVLSCVYTDREQMISENLALEMFQRKILKTASLGGVVYVIGNGGSAGIASHFSNDLMKALQIPSQTLYDSNLMTCLSNDMGYENVFSYPLERLIKPVDLLVAISSSGKSSNILKAVDVSQRRSASIITLSGFKKENPLREQGGLNLWIDREDYGLVETAHFFLLHTIVDLWNKNLNDRIISTATKQS